jgi:hypothetical protein
MSGAIMPLPLMIAAISIRLPPTIAEAVAPLAYVSVVPIVRAASSHEQGCAVSAARPGAALSLGSGTPITPVEETNTSLGSQPRCARPGHDLLDRLAPAIAGEGVAIAGVDHQRPRAAEPDLLAAQLDFGRAADVLGEHAGHRRAFGQLDIGQVAAVPFLVAARAPRAASPRQWAESPGKAGRAGSVRGPCRRV